MTIQSDELAFAVELAKQAGVTFKKYFGNSTATWKEDNTPVTEADREINAQLIRAIAQKYPADAVLGEEQSAGKHAARVWIIDPVDGTQAFANTIPISTIVIALVESGSVKLAVAYEPILDSMYYAEKGKGAYKNDRQIHCNVKDSVEQGYFATSSRMPAGYATSGQVHDRIEAARGKDFNFRSCTYSAMRVADGALSGCVFGVGRLFDIAAPALIVEEAGGKATDLNGDALDYVHGSNGVVITNGRLHQQLLDFVTK